MRGNSYVFIFLILTLIVVDCKTYKKLQKHKQGHLDTEELEIHQNKFIETEKQHHSEGEPKLLETKRKGKQSNYAIAIDEIDLDTLEPESQPSDQKLGENDDEDSLVRYTMFILLFIVGLHIFRHWLESKMDEYLHSSLYAIFRDVTILSFFLCISILLHYEEVFEDVGINWKEYHLGFALFIIVWISLGVAFIFAAQSIGRRWQQMEADCQDLRQLSLDYQQQYAEQQNPEIESTWSKKRQFIEIQNTFTFAVLRHSFINHKNLMILQECYLRNDFNFAMYLCKCLGLLVGNLFQLAFTSYVFIFICLILWWALRQLDDEDQAVLILFIPLIILIMSMVTRYKLKDVLQQIIVFPGDPGNYILYDEQISAKRDVDIYKQTIPKPTYLEDYIVSEEGQTQRLFSFKEFKFIEEQSSSLNSSWERAIMGRVPSRHEILFPFDAFGPVLITFYIQTIIIIGCLWFVAMCTIHIEDIYNKRGDFGATCLLIIMFICWAATLGYYIPEILRLLSITSNTGMLKKNQIIDEVSQDQRKKRTMLSFKFYKNAKSYRKKQIKPQNKYKRDSQIIQLIMDGFQLLGNENSKIKSDQVADLGKLCGVQLDENQIKLIQEFCQVDSNQEKIIPQESLLQLEKEFTQDITLGPTQTIIQVLQYHTSQLYGSQGLFILPGDIRAFIAEIDKEHQYFSEEERDIYVKELLYLKNQDGELSILQIAHLVGNDLDHMRW